MKKNEIFYLFDPITRAYTGDYEPEVDQERTVAIKQTVYKDFPDYCTSKKPPAAKGKCWYKNKNWTTTDPNKNKKAVI